MPNVTKKTDNQLMSTPKVNGENSKMNISRSFQARDLGPAAPKRVATRGCVNVQSN